MSKNELASKIGGTPIIKISEGIFGKLESRNPAGSVKDRVAYYIVNYAIERGCLCAGGRVVEATSGNTGIGLAYVCSQLGLKFSAVMPSSMSPQRIELMKRYGAEILLTPAEEGMAGAVALARKMAEEGAYEGNQFGNPVCIRAHYETTAPEIFKAMPNVGYIVCGIGSGGTYMGIKKYVEEKGLNCKIIAVEPFESPLLSQGKAAAHKIQGIGANFVPSLVDKSKIDRIMTVKQDDAFAEVKTIFKNTGEKCGISSGAAVVAAKDLLAELQATACGEPPQILTILPDGGDRYDDSLYAI